MAPNSIASTFTVYSMMDHDKSALVFLILIHHLLLVLVVEVLLVVVIIVSLILIHHLLNQQHYLRFFYLLVHTLMDYTIDMVYSKGFKRLSLCVKIHNYLNNNASS